LIRNPLPPPVEIQKVFSDGKQYAIRGSILRLPIHTSSLQIDYTAGSLTIPERVHFRYKLDGLDGNWQDGGTRREAVYTNLGPGQYTFQVIASNNDGVWNDTGAIIKFEIPPAFVQTKLFLAVCIAVGVSLIWLLFVLRLRQAREKIRSRLEDRLAERERIALDLHDTFFQGIQGLLLRFNTALNILPPSEPARAILADALQQSDRVMLEGRETMIDLRAKSSGTEEIADALVRVGEELVKDHPADFRVTVFGDPIPLHSIVFEEMRLIGQEALFNAFRHARPSVIEVELSYTAKEVVICIRDDGAGIDDETFKQGFRSGHMGLISMRERAAKIDGSLDIWTRLGAGTEINLRVPASAAYTRPKKRNWREWITALFAREAASAK
jgi:signal transduction histidine kinase